MSSMRGKLLKMNLLWSTDSPLKILLQYCIKSIPNIELYFLVIYLTVMPQMLWKLQVGKL